MSVLEPFERLIAQIDTKAPDHMPLHQVLPNNGPTVGNFRALMAALASPPVDSGALKALREFAESFHFTVTDSFYKDAYLGIHEPDSVTIRLINNSVESGHIAKLEQRRRAALSKALGPKSEGSE